MSTNIFYRESAMDIRRVVGRKVRRYRIKAKLFQEELDSRIGVEQGYVSGLGLHTRAVTVYRDTLSERLQPLRYLPDCSGCFRLEWLPGGVWTRWKAPPCHGARQKRSFDHVQPPLAPNSGTQLGRSEAAGRFLSVIVLLRSF
jgi:hypothetical protein